MNKLGKVTVDRDEVDESPVVRRRVEVSAAHRNTSIADVCKKVKVRHNAFEGTWKK